MFFAERLVDEIRLERAVVREVGLLALFVDDVLMGHAVVDDEEIPLFDGEMLVVFDVRALARNHVSDLDKIV